MRGTPRTLTTKLPCQPPLFVQDARPLPSGVLKNNRDATPTRPVVELLISLQSIDQPLNPPIATSLRTNLRCMLRHRVEEIAHAPQAASHKTRLHWLGA
jgi:hypothetical protein